MSEIKNLIKNIVAWQFDQTHNLTPEAYKDSLNMIADQILNIDIIKQAIEDAERRDK